MGLDAVMCFRIFEPLGDEELSSLDSSLRRDPATSQGAPIEKLNSAASHIRIQTGKNGAEGEILLPTNENWYQVSLVGPYSGADYEKPGALNYIAIAELTLSKVPQAYIYYGDDEHSLAPFAKADRDELQKWARTVVRET